MKIGRKAFVKIVMYARKAFFSFTAYGILVLLALSFRLSSHNHKTVQLPLWDVWSWMERYSTELAADTSHSHLHSMVIVPEYDQPPQLYGRLGKLKDETTCHEIISVPDSHRTVVDLSCTKPWRTAFYHRLIDCFAPSLCALMPALSQMTPLVIIIPPYLSVMYRYFLSGVDGHMIIEYQEEKRPSFCVSLPQYPVTLIYPDWDTPQEEQGRYLATVRKLGESKDGMLVAAERKYVTLIFRHWGQDRCFQDANRILEGFTSRLGLPGRMYFGNESFAETMKLFYNSRVVIGFHGAGLANTIFCSEKTIVLEYTTFLDMDGTKMWRSNVKVMQLHGGLNWLTHTIDIDHMANMTTLANKTDVDHYIKTLKVIHITGSDLHNSVERVRRELVEDFTDSAGTTKRVR